MDGSTWSGIKDSLTEKCAGEENELWLVTVTVLGSYK